MARHRISPLLRRLLGAPVCLYRWHCGWMLGHRFLLLEHTGRRTGRRHQTVLEVIAYRPASAEFVVMSGWGHDAAWFRNLAATPDLQVRTGRRRFAAGYRVLDLEEAVQVLAGYERRHRLAGPLVRAVLGRLLGWRYDGSEPARRRLAAQLPVVAFRPRG